MYVCIYAFSGDFSRMCKTTPLLEYWAAGWCPSTAKTHQRGSFWRVRQTALNESSKSMFLGPWVSWAAFGHLFNAVSTRFSRHSEFRLSGPVGLARGRLVSIHSSHDRHYRKTIAPVPGRHHSRARATAQPPSNRERYTLDCEPANCKCTN